jgi:hypothetical protein
MSEREVGPVLHAGAAAAAVIDVIRATNEGARVEDRGGYLRVLVPGTCKLERAAVERALGRAFSLPGDLERIMPSFRGRFVVDEDQARWEATP